jgi:hypothetical protein
LSEDNLKDQSVGAAEEKPSSLLATMTGPLRWAGNGIIGLAVLVFIMGIVATLANDEGFQLGIIIGPAIIAATGWLCRYVARRIEIGDGPELPVVISWVFLATGATMAIGGGVLAFDEPGGFALIAMGLVFFGAGYFVKRFFATPVGKKAISVFAHEVGIQTLHRDGGVRRQSSTIYLDEHASAEEAEAARQAWYHEQLLQRPDWVEGKIVGEQTRSGGILRLTAWVWSVFCLLVLAAGFIWGGLLWVGVLLSTVFTLGIWAAVIRIGWHRRKYGTSHFLPEQTPFFLGELLEGEIVSGISKTTMLKDGFRLHLQCVHRWEETGNSTGSGNKGRSHRHRDVLWREERRNSGLSDPRGSNFLVRVRFRLPTDQPATTLSAVREGITWELVVSAEMPGLDYKVTFELPVLEPGALG